jgi:hypothetical protein
MKLREIIIEGGMKKIHKNAQAAVRNATTYPDQNMSTGSAYLNYRMGIAMAGAPEYPTKADNFVGGDPFFAPYTDEEMAIIDYAAKQIGSSGGEHWTNGKSEERSDTNKTSVTAKPKRNRYGV